MRSGAKPDGQEDRGTGRLPVVKRSAMPLAKITVTERDINEGIVRHSSHCAVAVAIKRTLPGTIKHSMDLATIRYSDPEKKLRYICLTPRPVQRYIVDFDKGSQIHPFSFWLRPIQILAMSVGGKRVRPKRATRPDALPVDSDKKPKRVLVGGKPIPTMGTARAYGLRGLDR